MPAVARLPGIQFEVVAPPSTEALVRMDIAAFVGFAASGPLQLPVAIEDIAHFHEIFGDDLVIANDASQPVYAYLPSAVRAFFRNGGRRCWIIRVAGETASANQFPIPGLYQLRGNATQQAHARARSEGSWSDDVIVGTALRSHTLEVTSIAADPYVVGLSLSGSDSVAAGDLLKLTFGDPNHVLWFFVDKLEALPDGSPPITSRRGRPVIATASTVLCCFSASPPAPTLLPSCERLTLDVFVQRRSQSWSLTDLGFGPAHPRYWAALPDDATLYRSDTLEGLAAEAAHPRFPLAGMDDAGFYLPLEVGPLPLDFRGPERTDSDGGPAIARDGLSEFRSDLFLTPALSDTRINGLLQKADSLYVLEEDARIKSEGKTSPKLLRGIHAALAIDEATIIAVPDAVHRGWSEMARSVLSAPPDSSPLQHPEWWHFLDCRQPGEIPRVPNPPLGQFQPCELLIVTAPFLECSPVQDNGSFSLTWTPLPGAVDFLEEATDPDFVSAALIRQGSSGQVTISSLPAGDYYYRLRRQVGTVSSDYSNGVAIRIEGSTGWQLNTAADYQDDGLLAVHSALLRMCAARGDLFAVLAMPQHYRESDAMAYASQLKSTLTGGDQTAFSFGALYYPWLMGREEDDLLNLRTTPPDGCSAGILAKRSSERGAWISPANEPLSGIVDLVPPVLRSSRQSLQDALINLVRQEPNGFLCLSAVTLSDDPDLSSINVRRLLSFLRKTALRDGVNYVFEPYSDEFRRAVQREFENLLDELLLRGAFAGRTARDSFQVVTDSTLNTPQAIDRGQFYVELRVAPSVPLRFLTIRLLQTADRTSVTEGR